MTDEVRDLHIATIPYFLYLASLSEMISNALFKDVLHTIDLDVASKKCKAVIGIQEGPK